MKRLFRWLADWDRRLRLGTKLLVSYCLVVSIPAVCIGYFSYQKSSAMIEQQAGRAYREALRQMSVNITYRLREIEYVSELLYTNEELQQILRRAASGEATMEEVLDDFSRIQHLIGNLERSRNIFRIRLYVDGEPLYASERLSIFPLSELSGDPIVEELTGQLGQMKWRNTYEYRYLDHGTQRIVTLFRSIKDFEQLRSTLGIVAIDMDERIFREVFEEMNVAEQNTVFVFDGDTLITSWSAPTAVTPKVSFRELAGRLHELDGQGGTGVLKIGDGSYLVVLQRLDYVGWTLASLLPMELVTGSGRSIGLFTVFLVLTFTLLAVALSFLLSRRITSRVRALSDSMKRIELGIYDNYVDVSGNDEIAQLQHRFNKMLSVIRSLIEEVYKITISKQEAELKVLGGQINSHFLYNTLDTIKWMAFKRQAHDIVRVVDALSRFFRFGLNRGREVITVQDELNHVQTYVDIQNVRFKNNIRLKLDIDSAMLGCDMIKLVLQPLIENSIVHGIQRKDSKSGTIIVRGIREHGQLKFRVIDDGVGMTRETAAALLTREGQSYGLKNVNQRIRLYYGDDYGLSIWSRPGIGTCVEVTLADKVVVTPVDPLVTTS